jgi:hypothetical protein
MKYFLFSSFSKKVTSRSVSDVNSILINSISIDHIQNHFLPGNTGITYDMYYYLTPSTTDPMNTTITQIACVDYRFVFDLNFSFNRLYLVVDHHNGMKISMVQY